MCPTVLQICSHCKLRGHLAGDFCLEGKHKLLEYFEQVADSHFYLQYRRKIFPWGFIYIPTKKAAEKIAQRYSYDVWIHLPIPKARQVIERALAPPETTPIPRPLK